MAFKKSGDTFTKRRISKQEHDLEEVPIEVEHIDNEMNNHESKQI